MDELVLTYRELGERLGIEPDSARARARRRGWRVILDNHGVARVHVPPGELPDTPPLHLVRTGYGEGEGPDVGPDTRGAVDRLSAELGHALEEVRDARTRLEKAVEEAGASRLETVRATARLEAEERAHAAETAALRQQIETEVAARNAVIEELRAELARLRRPWWRRWLE